MNNIRLLEFSNPVFNKGVNVTVRRGTKWANEDRAFVQLGGGHKHGPVILNTRSLPFTELTDIDVMHEHDPSCRTVAGLSAEMKRVYPEFTETDIITLVTFMLPYTVPLKGHMVWFKAKCPEYAGNIEEVIALNDDFYEIKFGIENSAPQRAIVHAANYLHDVDDEYDGWVISDTY